MNTLPRWVEVWGPVVLVLSAMWLMVNRSEDRLTARIEQNRQAIEAARADVQANGQAIAALSGYVRGLHKMDLAEDEDR